MIKIKVLLFFFTLYSASQSWSLEENFNLLETGNKAQVNNLAKKIQKRFPLVPIITPIQLKKEISKVVLLDVRPKKERVISIIPGAINLETFNKNISKYKNKKIVAYCTIGARSSRVVEKLIKRGHNAFNLKGSLLGWINYGGKLVKESGEQTKEVYLLGGRHLIPSDHTPRP